MSQKVATFAGRIFLTALIGIFFTALPYSYSQNIFYTFMLGVMTVAAVCLFRKKWTAAHLCLVLLLLWEIIFIFVLNIKKRGNYDYYQIVLTTILLFFPRKIEFLKISFVVLYFLASSIKINDGWILGTYWSALETGMPLFPDEMIPLATNVVIFMEMIGTWFLLSRYPILQRLALAFFITFSSLLRYYSLVSLSSHNNAVSFDSFSFQKIARQ